MKEKICFLSVDVEPDLLTRQFQGVEQLDKLLAIFKSAGVSASLFITGQALEKYPEKVKQWAKDFEIGCHSYSHTFGKIEAIQSRDIFTRLFNKKPTGFRAPSHIIDEAGLKELEQSGFLYDSSVLPHYPFFKKYRGFLGKAPKLPYWPSSRNCRQPGSQGSKIRVLEIPVTGQILGIPLVGTWLRVLPFLFFQLLFFFFKPKFIVLTFHSWDSLSPKTLTKAVKIIKLLGRHYHFKTGQQIYAKFS